MTTSKPLAVEPPPVTPNFIIQQNYLNAAPAGIDARYAWTIPGGKGQGVRIIDIESAWRFSHEDLIQNQGGVIGGIQFDDIRWRDHGTAVLGVLGGDENTIGITVICPQANVSAISNYGPGQTSAKAISDAANALNPGDIILIEEHLPGPRFDFQERDDQGAILPWSFGPQTSRQLCMPSLMTILYVRCRFVRCQATWSGSGCAPPDYCQPWPHY